MAEIAQLQKKQNRILLLVSINFLLFMILFSGMGLVIWKSISLVNRLNSDLVRAEETVAELRGRIDEMDAKTIVERISQTATEQVTATLRQSLSTVDVSGPVQQLSESVGETREILVKTDGKLQAIQEGIAQLDNEIIARKVAEYVLEGLREHTDSDLITTPRSN